MPFAAGVYQEKGDETRINLDVVIEGEVNQDGDSHGKGVYSLSNGRGRYVGEWSNNKRHGHGTMTYADGRVESGKWEKDTCRFLG